MYFARPRVIVIKLLVSASLKRPVQHLEFAINLSVLLYVHVQCNTCESEKPKVDWEYPVSLSHQCCHCPYLSL